MKHLIKSHLLLFLTFALISCDNDDKSNSVTFIDPVPTTNASAQDFFSALQESETQLNIKYGFRLIVQNNGQIDYTKLVQSDFRRLARVHNITIQDIKSQYFEDIYHFSLNYSTLQDRENTLRNYNNDLFNIYVSKTFETGQVFSLKRIAYYNTRAQRLEEALENAGLVLRTVWALGESPIALPLADITKLRQAPARLKNQLVETSRVCTKLNEISISSDPFTTNNVSVEDCSPESSILYYVGALNLASLSNQNILQPRAIRNAVKDYTDVKTLELHQIANYFLGENMIYISHNSATGLDMTRRGPWARSIRQSYQNTAPHIVRIALRNNLYENLIFKKKVIKFELLSNSNLSPAEKAQHRNVISTIDRITSGIQYDSNLTFSVGISPVDGFVFNY
ncbi:MAG: hypothetical protein ACRBBP_08225 [Bdellovibrionales bacterium]